MLSAFLLSLDFMMLWVIGWEEGFRLMFSCVYVCDEVSRGQEGVMCDGLGKG
jgi:hypothetical protein